MLITLCYSVLTWMQSRQRTEIVNWIQECLVKEGGSIVFIRDRILLDSPRKGILPTLDSLLENSLVADACLAYGLSTENRSESFGSSFTGIFSSPSRNLNLSNSNVSVESNLSTPRKDYHNMETKQYDVESNSSVHIKSSLSPGGSIRQISELCYNNCNVRLRRLLWEEDRARAIVLLPQQNVELHEWTAFVDSDAEISNQVDVRKFYILFEAEPGQTHRVYYRKFTQFGRIVAWKCGTAELALILYSDMNQLIELMHIFRLGQIVLEGGWRVYRLTTINIEGTIGTLISRGELVKKSSLTPADLRRLSAGLYEAPHCNSECISCSTSATGTPKTVLTSDCQDVSKHGITTIDEEGVEECDFEPAPKLPNWYQRSPRKRSVTNICSTGKAAHVAPRRQSFCPSSLGAHPNKSGSLTSLLFCAKSLSLDEDFELAPRRNTASKGKPQPPANLKTVILPAMSAGSITPVAGDEENPHCLLSPETKTDKSFVARGMSSNSAYPWKRTTTSPKRIGKPPNILILCEDEAKRKEICVMLKTMLANDRYAVYDIRWDQLTLGGWSEQTALLVLAGKIPDKSYTSLLLQYLGDGGKLLSWCCENTPFGPETSTIDHEPVRKVIQYGPSYKVTQPLVISNRLWGATGDNQLPPGIQRILETSDSEGYSRPMTVSVYGKVKDTDETCIVQLDGGALGGKAILSQIHFEKCIEEDDSLALLSMLLSQNLGIDCTQIKAPEYTIGFLLGDHMKIVEFLTSNPSTVQQADLTVEFIPRGEKGSLPSHLRFPVRILECPLKFSTVEYYENLTTRELGRLVIYTDVITSTMNVISGHFLRHGLVAIAARQTSGRGRGNNVWLSPEGCACFSIQLSFDLDSAMGRRISLVQHIAGLAVILSVPNYAERGLRVKWPNDIYLNETKVGGVLVESLLQDKKLTVNIGMGINVFNEYPTISLNNASNGKARTEASYSTSFAKNTLSASQKDNPPLSIEKVIARTISELETLLDMVENGSVDKILNLYTQNWIHGPLNENEEANTVNVEMSEGNFSECRIINIDQFGFLRCETKSGHVFSVRPDGNSFDIANKLIAIKK
ncbi:unnamed protein product [Orchesella dallaii]|uniref:BPL/LPL catalytic domain-containing protein n=1 Tax=Orchesella dallaii TaxID=48710 RepID=A0ABP1RRA6_9HEXA